MLTFRSVCSDKISTSIVLVCFQMRVAGADPRGGGGGGAHPARAPPKIGFFFYFLA